MDKLHGLIRDASQLLQRASGMVTLPVEVRAAGVAVQAVSAVLEVGRNGATLPEMLEAGVAGALQGVARYGSPGLAIAAEAGLAGWRFQPPPGAPASSSGALQHATETLNRKLQDVVLTQARDAIREGVEKVGGTPIAVAVEASLIGAQSLYQGADAERAVLRALDHVAQKVQDRGADGGREAALKLAHDVGLVQMENDVLDAIRQKWE